MIGFCVGMGRGRLWRHWCMHCDTMRGGLRLGECVVVLWYVHGSG